MEETILLAKNAEYELRNVDEILDLHTEKYITLQKKIGNNKSILYKTSKVMYKLKESTRLGKMILHILAILGIFTIVLILIKAF